DLDPTPYHFSPALTVCDSLAEKSGGCPPDDEPCLQAIPDQCMGDHHCPMGKKCCFRSCFLQCLPKVKVKQGRCPTDPMHCLSPIQHLCNVDQDCSGKKRCCPGACGRDCRDPAKGATSPRQEKDLSHDNG
uniref:WAP four-disulfide core domain 5 n=1 Tax=Sarcophilus harrisii TaxID=9305 RepID=A0A7N4V1J8_SARHA